MRVGLSLIYAEQVLRAVSVWKAVTGLIRKLLLLVQFFTYTPVWGWDCTFLNHSFYASFDETNIFVVVVESQRLVLTVEAILISKMYEILHIKTPARFAIHTHTYFVPK